MRAAQHTDPEAFHAEGPVWWPDDGSSAANALRWVDLTLGDVLTLTPSGIERARVGGPVAAFLRPRVCGGAVVASERELLVSDDASLTGLRSFATLVDGPEARLNDGGCAPDGRLYAGTMRYDAAPGGGSLIEVSPDGTVREIRSDVTVSNGIDWSPDGSIAYYNDTLTRQTLAYSWSEAEGLHDPRRLCALDDRDPAVGPDGLCVDASGNVWSAIFGGSRVECRDATGLLLDIVELPVSNATACAFGGERLDRLFITTSREGLAPEDEPEAGAVFVAEPGVRGLPVRRFAG